MGDSNSKRQIQIRHSKIKFTTANSNSPRQIQVYHSKIQIRRGNIQFATANSS